MSYLLFAQLGEDVQRYIKNLPKSKSEEKKQKKEKRRDKKDHGDRPHSARHSDGSPNVPSKRVCALPVCCVCAHALPLMHMNGRSNWKHAG